MKPLTHTDLHYAMNTLREQITEQGKKREELNTLGIPATLMILKHTEAYLLEVMQKGESNAD